MVKGLQELEGVRIRGIYATALTKILAEGGYRIVQPSRIVSERLGLSVDNSPAALTVKSVEDRLDEILVVGDPSLFDRVFSDLSKLLDTSVRYSTPVLQYSTYNVRLSVEEGCRAYIEGYEFEVKGKGCIDGKLSPVCVVHPPLRPGEKGKARLGVCLYTPYFILNTWGELSFSRHIVSQEVLENLMGISSIPLRKGLGVKWSSNSMALSIEKLREKLLEGMEKIGRIAPGISSEGEALTKGRRIGIILTSWTDKMKLDRIRESIVPTAPYHHSLKSCGCMLGELVDYAEMLLEKGLDRQVVGETLYTYAWEKLASKNIVKIKHLSLTGKTYVLGPFRTRLLDINNRRLFMERTIKSEGVYDGLGIERKPGDTAETIVESGKWITIHVYKGSQGSIKGIYININTPPEPEDNSIKYIDLEIDTVYSGGEARVIDRDKLEKAYSLGVIGEKLYQKAIEEAEKVKKTLDRLVDNNKISQPEKIIEELLHS